MIEFNTTKIFTDNIDGKALEQLYVLDKTKVFEGQPVRIMPDVHAGAGCVIGFTAKISDKIIPNLVGVDIGCGMLCVELGKVDVDFASLDKIIREYIPSGRNVGKYSGVAFDLVEKIRCKKSLTKRSWIEGSLGTLGGGNHFIEIDGDEEGGKYLVIHSGSRNLGKQVAEYYQDRAAEVYDLKDINEMIKKLKSKGRDREIEAEIKRMKAAKPCLPANLCYLSGEKMDDYMHDMFICTEFADKNREAMAKVIIDKLFGGREVGRFTTRHNYIGRDGYIRKGAISAKDGERVLIPLNMRDGCIVGVGKGNPDWNYSAPHGAGRIMSRAQARQMLKVEDFTLAMKDVYSTTVSLETIDEAPFAYKPSDEIISLVRDTVEIEKIIKPLYNFKASE